MTDAMSFRSLIVPVLLLVLAGCDKPTVSNEQAAAPAPVSSAMPSAVPVEAGALDRSHKGALAPALAFERPDGTPTTLAAVMKASGGKPVLVNLWATWCGPCVKEMPTLDAAAADMTVVPISQDLERAPVTAFFAKRRFARLQPYFDPKTAFSIEYSATLPMSILFDSSGREVWRSTGGTDWTSAPARALLAEAT